MMRISQHPCDVPEPPGRRPTFYPSSRAAYTGRARRLPGSRGAGAWTTPLPQARRCPSSPAGLSVDRRPGTWPGRPFPCHLARRFFRDLVCAGLLLALCVVIVILDALPLRHALTIAIVAWSLSALWLWLNAMRRP